MPTILGQRGKIIRALEQSLKKRIRVIETSSSTGKMVEDLLTPAEVAGINTIWLPDGSTVRKVRIRNFDKKKLPASIDTLEDVILQLILRLGELQVHFQSWYLLIGRELIL